jgi:hypothetical protein
VLRFVSQGMLLVVSAFECKEVAVLERGKLRGRISSCRDVFDSPTGLSDAPSFRLRILHFGTDTRLCGEHAAPSGGWLGEARH